MFDLPFNSFISSCCFSSGEEADLQKNLAPRASLLVVVVILRCRCFFWGSSANVSPLSTSARSCEEEAADRAGKLLLQQGRERTREFAKEKEKGKIKQVVGS